MLLLHFLIVKFVCDSRNYVRELFGVVFVEIKFIGYLEADYIIHENILLIINWFIFIFDELII